MDPPIHLTTIEASKGRSAGRPSPLDAWIDPLLGGRRLEIEVGT
jgi:hypothetical protein